MIVPMEGKKPYKSALSVKAGCERASEPTGKTIRNMRLNKKKQKYTAGEYVEAILSGDRNMLSRAITLVESSLSEHRQTGQEVIKKCLPHSSSSVRIGITGVPGVGKSSFVESFGKILTARGRKIAVLAIDPTSERSKGSILGDKTRMEQLSSDPNAFIRPSPSGRSLGGVARKTRESIILCEAAGFDTIFVETVGVGQSETAVHSMVDFFLLLMLAGAGDELQGIKRGVVEMADMIAITKADGENINKADLARQQYENALHLFPPPASGWVPRVLTCSSFDNSGLPEIWKEINSYLEYTAGNGFFNRRRREQSRYWMYETINENLRERFYNNSQVAASLEYYEKQVTAGEISSFEAARCLLDMFKNSQEENSKLTE